MKQHASLRRFLQHHGHQHPVQSGPLRKPRIVTDDGHRHDASPDKAADDPLQNPLAVPKAPHVDQPLPVGVFDIRRRKLRIDGRVLFDIEQIVQLPDPGVILRLDPVVFDEVIGGLLQQLAVPYVVLFPQIIGRPSVKKIHLTAGHQDIAQAAQCLHHLPIGHRVQGAKNQGVPGKLPGEAAGQFPKHFRLDRFVQVGG